MTMYIHHMIFVTIDFTNSMCRFPFHFLIRGLLETSTIVYDPPLSPMTVHFGSNDSQVSLKTVQITDLPFWLIETVHFWPDSGLRWWEG